MSNSSLSLRSCSVEKAVRGRLSSCAFSRFFPFRDLGPEVNNNSSNNINHNNAKNKKNNNNNIKAIAIIMVFDKKNV